MDQLRPAAPHTTSDWDEIYRRGTPPWDTGQPASELVAVLREYKRALPKGPTLELGCGSGADAIYLAKRGFEVTAVESSPTALERARVRAEREDALLRFVLGDVFNFTKTSGQFDFVYEAGFYHFIRRTALDRYLDMLWRITYPGSYCLALVGATRQDGEDGPPQVSEDEVRNELGRLFDFVHLRPCRLESPTSEEGYPAWSCLMQRPVIAS